MNSTICEAFPLEAFPSGTGTLKVNSPRTPLRPPEGLEGHDRTHGQHGQYRPVALSALLHQRNKKRLVVPSAF